MPRFNSTKAATALLLGSMLGPKVFLTTSCGAVNSLSYYTFALLLANNYPDCTHYFTP